MEKIKFYLADFEEWAIYHDLHLWYGFISAIAIGVLLFIFAKEATTSEMLKDQVISLKADLGRSNLLVTDLRHENERQRSLYLLAPVSQNNMNQNVDKTAAKVNEKISKVQNLLIDKAINKAPQTKTEIVLNTIEVKTVVNKELNTMMKDSYCATVPSSKECKQ